MRCRITAADYLPCVVPASVRQLLTHPPRRLRRINHFRLRPHAARAALAAASWRRREAA